MKSLGLHCTLLMLFQAFFQLDSSTADDLNKRKARLSKAKFERISVQTSTGRSGVYFLPKDYRNKKRPAMLLFHGSSIDGSKIARLFGSLARKKRFIIIAPDSTQTFGWEISLDSQTPTQDQAHIEACLQEVLGTRGVRIDTNKFLVAGVSAGGALAAYYGSTDTRFSALAVLHGGVDIPSVGVHTIPVWLSTGSQDRLRPPSELMSYISLLNAQSFTDITYNEYESGHEVKRPERKALINWWLGQL